MRLIGEIRRDEMGRALMRTRYDLRALFDKAFGEFTVNVQGLSRVSICLLRRGRRLRAAQGMFPLKTFYWGQRGARENYALQIGNIVREAHKNLGELPVVIGECGVPMDMNDGATFGTGDWRWQARMMDAMLTGLERALVGFTSVHRILPYHLGLADTFIRLWNYNPPNTDALGDAWNGENFSFFSASARPARAPAHDQRAAELDDGGRVLRAVVRPYPAKTAGVPVRWRYEATTGAFEYEWRAEGGGETEIYLPDAIARGREVRWRAEGCEVVRDEAGQTLRVVARGADGEVRRIECAVVPPLDAEWRVNGFWDDWGVWVGAVVVVLAAVVFAVVR